MSAASKSGPSPDLIEALRQYQIELPEEQVRQIDNYCQLLWKWNEKINLTRHTDFDLFVKRDLIDSVQLAQLMATDRDALDIGSGGGVPGLLIAMMCPHVEVSVCESVAKKARVLDDIVKQLKLPVAVYHERVERLLEEERFDTLTARGVGSIAKILKWLAPHWASAGRLLLVKGPKWVEERGEARHHGLLASLELRRLAEYEMPGTHATSVILGISWKRE
ncbi:MAG: 16S rRNA (guanine(527)-N(7))-methyltransferase RsmG [Pirellulaceae bacterium]|nr:16S rRNA (guanine(527)-N(7))-methyltransferase RsmG [Planctomycetales bacterium]